MVAIASAPGNRLPPSNIGVYFSFDNRILTADYSWTITNYRLDRARAPKVKLLPVGVAKTWNIPNSSLQDD